jgi:nucleoside-diphosphate-sugar epimerase
MPVIVIGADTDLGHALVSALRPAAAELRLFASDPDDIAPYRSFAKVAVGDISDGSHVGAAATGAFCAVVIAAAAHDQREHYFAADPDELFAQWAEGLADAGIGRIIVVGAPAEVPRPDPLTRATDDYHHVDTSNRTVEEVVTVVVELDAAR